MKTIKVKVHPASSRNQILASTQPNFDFEIYTTASAINNKANLSIIKLLSKHLDLTKSKIIIIKGEKSKIKTLTILD